MSKPVTGAEELEKSTDELDLVIGRYLLADQLGSKPVADAEAKAAAGRWLASNMARFRQGVCGHAIVQAHLLDKKAQNRNELFAAMVDALLRVPGLGQIPIAVLAARLVHYGVGQLCENFQYQQNS
jgi:hypothetical protein